MKNFSIKKLYYSISEVSKITGLEQYVLRYWESEFEELKPQKNRAGNRIYTNRDINLILFIKRLLREERYTIEGAKQVLSTYSPSDDAPSEVQVQEPKPEKTVQTHFTFPVESSGSLSDDLMEIKRFLEDLQHRLRGH